MNYDFPVRSYQIRFLQFRSWETWHSCYPFFIQGFLFLLLHSGMSMCIWMQGCIHSSTSTYFISCHQYIYVIWHPQFRSIAAIECACSQSSFVLTFYITHVFKNMSTVLYIAYVISQSSSLTEPSLCAAVIITNTGSSLGEMNWMKASIVVGGKYVLFLYW